MPDGSLGRIHQEDLCQALGLPPSKKYQNKGGPTPQDVAGVLRSVSSEPEKDIRGFLDALIYNWVIVNPDAHSKNYSLLISPREIRLAPLYDLCSILPYRNSIRETPIAKIHLAMKIGKDYRIRKTDRASAWKRLSTDLGIPEEETLARVSKVSSQVPAAIEEAVCRLGRDEKKSKVIQEFLKEATIRARKCSAVPYAKGSSAGKVQQGNDQAGGRHYMETDHAQAHNLGSGWLPCPHKSTGTGSQCIMGAGHKSAHRYKRRT